MSSLKGPPPYVTEKRTGRSVFSYRNSSYAASGAYSLPYRPPLPPPYTPPPNRARAFCAALLALTALGTLAGVGYAIYYFVNDSPAVLPCMIDPEYCEHSCVDTGNSFYCKCNSGFRLQGDNKCKDIDECTGGSLRCTGLCINTFGSYKCSCAEGYTLDPTNQIQCKDVDECKVNNGGCPGYCINTIGSYMCACPEGYRTLLNTCQDIDECSEQTTFCEDVCVNTPGSYRCECRNGEQLHPNRLDCINLIFGTSLKDKHIYEGSCAEGNGGCQTLCYNAGYGYVQCGCPPGYVISPDGLQCIDLDECQFGQAYVQCGDQTCNNLVGNFQCGCGPGFMMDNYGACRDRNECFGEGELGLVNGGCTDTCINTQGSFHCECPDGYSLADNGITCKDVDECTTRLDVCDSSARGICTNTPGSYICTCLDGYSQDVNGFCYDLDECESSPCQNLCFNAPGTYQCNCRVGYRLGEDGLDCFDIDECFEGTGRCFGGSCINTEGSYACTCDTGYQLRSNFNCYDINECNEGTDGVPNGGCEQICENHDGSYECHCNPGYELHTDRRGCVDIDECETNQDDCDPSNRGLCTNTVGSYICGCIQGWVHRNNQDNTCIDFDECAIDNGGCEHICDNLNNGMGRVCSCFDGYTIDDDGIGCRDIDECSVNNGGCEYICVNEEPEFTCLCPPGYKLNSNQLTCSDINECTEEIDNCEHTCFNTEPGFYCGCADGFRVAPDGKDCIAVNECNRFNGGCEHTCINDTPGYRCECDIGYRLASNDHACVDIDECDLGRDNCEYQCINEEPGFSCVCPPQYRLNFNGYDCDAINYCNEGTDMCAQICIFENPGYSCECNAGFTLNVDGYTCDVVTTTVPPTTTAAACPATVTCPDASAPSDCQDVYDAGVTTDGVCAICVGGTSMDVFCDMDTATDSGWLVFQRRFDGDVPFDERPYAEYEAGFGSADDEYWLGLANLFLVTSNKPYQLQVDLVDVNDLAKYANYDSFAVADASDKYRLSVGTFSPGTPDAGNSLARPGGQNQNGMQFTTVDSDNDNWGRNCAVVFRGGWWYNACHKSNLNGFYYPPGPITTSTAQGSADGVSWESFSNTHAYSLKETTMKLKPV